METRGRESKSEREVVKLVPDAAPIRPEPPARLSAEQAEEWRLIVSSMSPDWFRKEYTGVLVSYCRQIVRANYFHDLADAIPTEVREADGGMKQHAYFARMAEKADRAAEKFATTLRITPQSRYDANKAARDSNKTQNARPW